MEVARTLIHRDSIAARIADMGRTLTGDLIRAGAGGGGDGSAGVGGSRARVVLVPILTGSLVFVADLIRNVPVKMSIRPVTITSYPGAAMSSQGASIEGAVPTDLGGAHVVIADDILDSGRTLGLLKRVIAAQRPASLRVAVLLRKHKAGGREEHVDVDYVGFDIEDEFVVGYGLDYDGYFRNLPDIAVLGPPV